MRNIIIILSFILSAAVSAQQIITLGKGPVKVIPTSSGSGSQERTNLIVTDGFDNTSSPWAKWQVTQNGGQSWSRTQSTTNLEGGYSFRAEVRSGCDGYASSGYRSEMSDPFLDGGGAFADAGTMWYGVAMRFESPVSGGNWTGSYGGHFFQWHPDNGSGSAVLSLWGSDGKWDVHINPSGGGSTSSQGTKFGGGALDDIVANTWHSVVFKVNWSSGSNNGKITCWIDGVKYYDNQSVTWTTGRYIKLGMNRWGDCATPGCPSGSQGPCDTWIIYYDALRIGNSGATYNDVAPVQVFPEPN